MWEFQTPWKKRKRRDSENFTAQEETTHFIALGTSSGSILLYSIATAQVETTIENDTGHSVSCITWEHSNGVYVGAEQFILQFDLKKRSVKR